MTRNDLFAKLVCSLLSECSFIDLPRACVGTRRTFRGASIPAGHIFAVLDSGGGVIATGATSDESETTAIAWALKRQETALLKAEDELVKIKKAVRLLRDL